MYCLFPYSYPGEPPLLLNLSDIRPRSRQLISLTSVKCGDIVMVNYNIDEPKSRGYWYDLKVTQVVTNGKKRPFIKGTISVGSENTQLENCIIAMTDKVMAIEPAKLISERTKEELKLMQTDTIIKSK